MRVTPPENLVSREASYALIDINTHINMRIHIIQKYELI